MLDVHPPHAPTHTWKDFFIHIATICVGLLIAVSLEQTVEAVHHHHQAHELEEQLQDEARQNVLHRSRSYFASDAELIWLLGLQKDVQTMLAAHVKLAYRPRPQSEPGVPVIWELPRTGVWDAARQSGLVALLPSRRAEQYTADYNQVVISFDYRTRFFEALTHQQAFESKFVSAQCPLTPDLTLMSPQQLDQYSTLIGETYAAGLAAKNRLRIAEWVHDLVLNEMTPQEADNDRITALRSHPDQFPPLTPGAQYTGSPAPPLCR